MHQSIVSTRKGGDLVGRVFGMPNTLSHPVAAATTHTEA